MKPSTVFRRIVVSSLVVSRLPCASALSRMPGSSAFSKPVDGSSRQTILHSEKRTMSTNTESNGQQDETTAHKKNPINVFGIDHVVLLVDDLEGMAEWYETVLGCTVAKRNEKFQMIHLDAGSALIDLVDKTGPLGRGTTSDGDHHGVQKMDHLCLALTDFDEPAIREHLKSHGVAITTELGVRYGKGGYGESLYFEDPEGTRIEIKQSRLLG